MKKLKHKQHVKIKKLKHETRQRRINRKLWNKKELKLHPNKLVVKEKNTNYREFSVPRLPKKVMDYTYL